MSGPPSSTARTEDDAEVVAQSLEQPELFARLYDRYDITEDTFLIAFEDDKGVPRAENDYTEISVLLDAYVMPSKGLASLYRAVATLPGGKVTDHLVETKAGTRAIALSYDRGDDPRTGEPTRTSG